MNEFVKNLSRLEFVLTKACTGRCRHCSQGDHTGSSGCLDAALAVRAIRDVAGRWPIRSMMVFGGEPLLYPDAACAIFRAGRDVGIPRRDLITNGFFSRNADRISAVAGTLAESGVNKILLSVDAFHQETIPIGPVKFFARRLRAFGVPVGLSPAWLVAREDENPYNQKTRAVLREFADLEIPVWEGNVIFPEGNALKNLADYFDPASPPPNPYEQDPRDIRAISFEPDGRVLGGDLNRQSILEILDGYRPE